MQTSCADALLYHPINTAHGDVTSVVTTELWQRTLNRAAAATAAVGQAERQLHSYQRARIECA
jgi:hypothetical protein